MPLSRFKVSNKRGSNAFPQAELDFGRRLKEEGMQRAADHANQETEGWTDKAYEFVKRYIETADGNFMTEDVRLSSQPFLPAPSHSRAWGSVMIRASKEGLIKKVGHSTVKNAKAHHCFASLWKRI